MQGRAVLLRARKVKPPYHPHPEVDLSILVERVTTVVVAFPFILLGTQDRNLKVSFHLI